METNQITLSGTIVDISDIKVSPAGVRQQQFRVRHCSKQQELNQALLVDFEIVVVLIADQVELFQSQIQLSNKVLVTGFIDIAGYYAEQKQRMVLRAQEVVKLKN